MKEKLQLLIEKGLIQKDIAIELGITAPYVSMLIKKYGLKQLKNHIKRKRYSSPKCQFCGETKVSEFFTYNKVTCKNCLPIQKQKGRHSRKIDVVNYKGGKCQICGYNKSPFVLELHHIDPNTKDKLIMIQLQRSRKFDLDKYKEELDKCILLCCNCHKEIHRGVTQLPKELCQ